MMTSKMTLWVCLIFFLSKHSFAQDISLREEIIRISGHAKGTVGVALMNLETGDTLSYNGQSWMGMQSVLKFPLAVTVLRLIDQGKYHLEQPIPILKSDLPENYSPLRDKYPEGHSGLPISTLLSYVVSLSDNDVCDILLDKVTSKKEVEQLMHQLGIKGFELRATESEMLANWNAQFSNRARPLDLLKLLEMTYSGNVLSAKGKEFLWKIMEETSTTPQRMKGMLPPGTPVGHKSGTSATDKKGISPSTNDIGMITLPNGQHLALVVLLFNSAADKQTRDNVIARIARACYDHYQK
ncbi:class A beta-lactamase [Pedobacter sp. AW31-3R]|uniref:class A beta-lactamase n=1 Tax=Pedobacter sp. AW31-3R TaxID=3445781 RepID=UPI003FA04674